MSNPNFEQIAAAQQANAEVLMAVVRAAFNGIERLSALNIAATREFFSNSVANTQQLLAAKDANSVAKLNTELAQPSMEKWVEYSRNVYELTSELQKEIGSVLEAQYGSFAKNATAAVEKASAGAPGGDVFAATLKSVLNASNQAFEQLTSVSKQLAEIAETNIQLASKAPVAKAPAKSSATSAAAKKASK